MPCLVDELVHLHEPCGLCVRLSYASRGSPVFSVILFPAHPQLGGSRDHPLLECVAQRVGRSGGVALSYAYPEEACQQAGGVLSVATRTAMLAGWPECLALLQRLQPGPVFGFGYSVGAQVLLDAASAGHLRSPMLVAPPLARQGMPMDVSLEGRPLILMGDQDFACTQAQGRQLCSLLGPETELQVLAGSDHFLRGDEDLVARRALIHWGFPVLIEET